MKPALLLCPLCLIALLITAPASRAAVHAVENFGLDEVEKQGDQSKYSKGVREGFRLSKTGKPEESFKAFSDAAAKHKELAAYLALGVMHREGRGTPRNVKLAKENFKKAVEKGSSAAGEELVLLGFMSPDNPEEFNAARKQLEKFAQEGMAVAKFRLGLAHLTGYGYKADAVKAIHLLNQAAESTGPYKHEAAYILGKLYRDGNTQPEIKPDSKLAELWLKKAAEQKNLSAMRALGEFYLSADPKKQNFTLARQWFTRLQQQGDAYGHYYLGQISENGWGEKKSLELAAEYYRKAAAKNVTDAVYRLAIFHESGLGGIKKDMNKATEFYRQGAELGHAICMYNLSVMLEKVDKDSPLRTEIMPWLLRAAAAGLVEAEYQIGLRYFHGRGVQNDLVASAAWLDRAARSNHAQAQLHLGQMYANGQGVKRSYGSARRLYQLSAKGGNLGGMLKYTEVMANGIGGNPDLAEAYVFAEKAITASASQKNVTQVAIKLRDDLVKIMTPEQIAEGKRRLAGAAKPKP